MKPGHPFDTEDRDQTRARQRRLLRLLHQAYVEEAAAFVTAVSGPDDMTEMELRRIADVELASVPDEILTAMERGAVGNLITGLFTRFDEIAMRAGRRDHLVGLFEEEATRTVADRKRGYFVDPASGDVEARLHVRRAAIALVVADAASDDEYRDPVVRRLVDREPPAPTTT